MEAPIAGGARVRRGVAKQMRYTIYILYLS
jgi:hypothetical protein